MFFLWVFWVKFRFCPGLKRKYYVKQQNILFTVRFLMQKLTYLHWLGQNVLIWLLMFILAIKKIYFLKIKNRRETHQKHITEIFLMAWICKRFSVSIHRYSVTKYSTSIIIAIHRRTSVSGTSFQYICRSTSCANKCANIPKSNLSTAALTVPVIFGP